MIRRFLLRNIMLGVGLSMDAFSISVADGLREPDMPAARMCGIAGIYGGFQAFMPVAGWLCVSMAAGQFAWFGRCIPWMGAALLGWIGLHMLYARDELEEIYPSAPRTGILLLQGAATSMDALSVGFAIAGYDFPEALASAGIIAAVTFCVCLAGLKIGRWSGAWLARRATVFGGVILLAAALETLFRAALAA